MFFYMGYVPTAGSFGLTLSQSIPDYVGNSFSLVLSRLILIQTHHQFIQTLQDDVLRMWMTTTTTAEQHETALPQLVGLFDGRDAEEDALQLDKEIQFNSINQKGYTASWLYS